jgi:hypothetical protein
MPDTASWHDGGFGESIQPQIEALTQSRTKEWRDGEREAGMCRDSLGGAA